MRRTRPHALPRGVAVRCVRQAWAAAAAWLAELGWLRRGRGLAQLVVIALSAGGALLLASVAAVPASGQQLPVGALAVFNTPGTHTWQVPAGVPAVVFELYGAEGGKGCRNIGCAATSLGGPGGRTTATVLVDTQRTFVITVGGRGGDTEGGIPGHGGFGGGGQGGAAVNWPLPTCSSFKVGGGGGGGASSVSLKEGPTLAIAGGGGGAGACYPQSTGGAGGGLVGGNGLPEWGGSGGTQTGPGPNLDGSQENDVGLPFADCRSRLPSAGHGGPGHGGPGGIYGGGGGGGGYWGGSGGDGGCPAPTRPTDLHGREPGGGGGGSGFVHLGPTRGLTVTAGETTSSEHLGNGQVVVFDARRR